MFQVENRILGQDNKIIHEHIRKNVFDAKIVWQVKKQGCGTNLINGTMAYEMLSPDGKKKALKGIKKISDNGFVFERVK